MLIEIKNSSVFRTAIVVAFVSNKEYGAAGIEVGQDVACKAIASGVDNIYHIFPAHVLAFPVIYANFHRHCSKLTLYLFFPLVCKK